MNILQTVVVKQVLTELSKETLTVKLEQERMQLMKELDQLSFEQKKLEKAHKSLAPSLAGRVTTEVKMREEKLRLVDFKLEQLHMLPLGSELREKEVQALVEVKIGDVWAEIVTEKAIIIKDGIVTEIRSV